MGDTSAVITPYEIEVLHDLTSSKRVIIAGYDTAVYTYTMRVKGYSVAKNLYITVYAATQTDATGRTITVHGEYHDTQRPPVYADFEAQLVEAVKAAVQ